MSRPASVVIATTFYRPVLGGAEAAAERLATYLRRRGHAVSVFTKRTAAGLPDREVLDDVEVVRFGPAGERTGRGKWVFMPALYRKLRERASTYDAVVCVDYRAIGLAALAARRFTKKPVIFQAQTEGVIAGDAVRARLKSVGFHPDGIAGRVATWPIRASYARADAIGCISRAIEREALAAGVPRAKVHYLPNPVDIDRFAPASADERRRLRDELGIRSDSVVCVFVGRLSREKGIVELVRAWTDARPPAELVVIGPPMTRNAWDVSEEARAIAASSEVSAAIRFVGGVPADEVARWLRAADFAAQPSHFEAMGLAAAEEMAAGLPVVATDTGGYRDFVTDGETGLLVPVGDVAALARAVSRLASDAPLRERLGRAARARAEEFDARVVLERFARLIDTLATHG